MEWILTVLPIGLVLLVCVGLHAFMMRGGHGGHGSAAGHGAQTQSSAQDPEGRIAHLERQVNRLRQELEVSRNARAPGAGSDRKVVATPTDGRDNVTHGNHVTSAPRSAGVSSSVSRRGS